MRDIKYNNNNNNVMGFFFLSLLFVKLYASIKSNFVCSYG